GYDPKANGLEDWEQKEPAENMMVTGPLLSLNTFEALLDSGSFNLTRHPRTAIGIKPGGKVILLTVDGRNENSAGMSLFELRKIMQWLGCTSSINLDGGGSSTLWVAGEEGNGVVNYPTDNKKWDHDGERNVANVILLKKKP
ncbi:MAG: phosphodiester glycosidase family protein, partial [Chitinophagaceae bacterium]